MTPVDRVVTQAFDNAVGLFRALALAANGGDFAEGDGVVLVHTGSPVASFNPTFITRQPSNVHTTLRHIEAFYGEHGAPFVIYARASDAQFIARHAQSAGFSRVPDERGLTLSVDELTLPPPHADLEIVVVRDAASLATFHETSARSFAVPSGWLGDLEIERLLAVPGLTLYLGLLNNEPVSSGALFVSGSTAGVHIIGTVPEHRRRGLGEAMTWRVIHDGASAGCLTCALTSSDLSHGMYQRMGFEHVANYAVWQKE